MAGPTDLVLRGGVGVRVPRRSIDADGHDGSVAPHGSRRHLVGRRGERATRLSVPDAPRLCGPTAGFPVDSPLDRCLRRVLGNVR